MFEITGKDISDLNDVDLRTLIAKLCEAELRRVGLPVAALTAGGDQNAADGGLDVRVSLEPHDKDTDFIPRAETGFQVKEPDMPRAAILDEMCPGGILRPIINELASKQGAYIIVSSHGSVADKPLRDRIAAMRDAVRSLSNPTSILLDFYDRERLARWAEQYQGVALWTLKQLGRPMAGWQPYRPWSARSDQTETEYFTDKESRIYDALGSRGEGLTVEEGITRMREILAKPRGTVRLIGLSGVGKTRLVETLFDNGIGANALDSAVVAYTDLSDDPTPSPRDLLHGFVQSHQRAIIVVDNCPPSTHQALVKANTATSSQVSIITVEYDVSDDEPEDTEVFRLEAASEEVIENLIKQAEPHISQVDRRRIFEFSGGNARIALALARRVQKSENIGHLSDEDLFRRLFLQRHSEDPILFRVGEVCSLVYSFDGEATEGNGAELPLLAEMVGISVDELYRHIQELKERDLIQRRSKWRAVLPHALANKLAHRALDRIPPSTLSGILIKRAPERLLRSFSRRLGYLHQCDAAQSLVSTWLSREGLLGAVEKLSPLVLAMLENVAPVSPDAALTALERAMGNGQAIESLTPHSYERNRVSSLLASLAYDHAMFERSAFLLARMASTEPQNNNTSSAGNTLRSLFQLYLSGTHASVQQRLHVIRTLIGSSENKTKELGLAALNQMLETGPFSSHHNFEFGARSRDHGSHPQTGKEIAEWYGSALSFALERLATQDHTAVSISAIIAKQFCGLWCNAGMLAELEVLALEILKHGSWADGWIRVRTTLRLHGAEMPADSRRRLQTLEAQLRPDNLLDLARAYVLSPQWSDLDLCEGDDNPTEKDPVKGYQRANDKAEELGREFASKPDLLEKLLPELMQGSDAGRRFQFGTGLAMESPNIPKMWQKLKTAFASHPAQERQPMALRGFLNAAAGIAPLSVADFLDAAVQDSCLGPVFPYLQCSVTIDEPGVSRLLDALAVGIAPIWNYAYLSFGGVTEPISSKSLQGLLNMIADKPDGIEIAIQILLMKLFPLRGDNISVPSELIACGRELLLRYEWDKHNNNSTHRIVEVLKVSLIGFDADVFVQDFCTKLSNAIWNENVSLYDCKKVLAELFKSSPLVALNAFIKPKQSQGEHLNRILRNERYPLEIIPVEVMLEWANEEPQSRFLALASATSLFIGSENEYERELSQTAIALIDAAPDKEAVLKSLRKHLYPSGGVGSFAVGLDRRREALTPLTQHADPVVAQQVAEWDNSLKRWAEEERARERKEDERFE